VARPIPPDAPITLDPVAYDTWLNRALAPFFPRYRVLLALAQEPAHRRGPLRNLVLSHDRRLMFLRNQKCACTQTTQLLYAYGNNGEFYPGNVHRADRGILSGRYRWPEIKPVFESHAAFLFTFVRHPESRAHSAFRNFFVDQKNIARGKHLGPMRAHGYDPAKGESYNFDVFLDYVSHSLAVDPVNTDSHWRLQVDNIALHDIAFDLIGRVETYAADIRTVFERAGITGFSPDAMLEQRFNRSGSARSEVTPAQRARIEALYARDYQAFGY